MRNKAERAERAERAQIDLDRDVQEVTEIGRKAEADYEIFKSTREKACPKRCGGVMWLIDGRLICGSCRAEG